MYLYSLYGYEHNAVLTHEKQFTAEEFIAMCDEVPKWAMEDMWSSEQEPEIVYYYDDYEVEQHLINKHGFKMAEYQGKLFVD